MHQVLLTPRLQSGFKTTDPQHIIVHKADGDKWGPAEQIVPQDYPIFGHFPLMLPPKMLWGSPPPLAWGDMISIATLQKEDTRTEFVMDVLNSTPTGQSIMEPFNYDLTLFSRMIAKIAYCHAAVSIGLDSFLGWMISDYILGHLSFPPNFFVGSDPLTMVRPTPDSTHSIKTYYVPIRGLLTVVATVQLFSFSGAPEYQVYLGHATSAGWINSL